MEEVKNNILTDEQVDEIAKQMDGEIKDTSLEKIAQFPSNNNQEETKEEDREEGYKRPMNVMIDPNTGEHKIVGLADELDDNETFEEMCERIKNSDIKLEETPITESELLEYITNKNNGSLLNDIASETELSSETIRALLQIVNKKMNNDDFNVYKEFPQEIQKMIDKYMTNMQIPAFSTEGRRFRNMICDELISEFISNISLNRVQTDFNKEIETLFTKGSTELADSIVGYTEERNKKYREYAEKMEDEDKKKQVNDILDKIDEAYELTELKEFAKKCKIKKFDLEKPEKIFSDFLRKYENSKYNVYDINMTRPILYRNLNTGDEEEYNQKDIDGFLVCFCKQCMNKRSDIVIDHSYMYYVIYNIVLMDMNKGEQKHVSDKFIENIKEVIINLRERNNNFN